MAYAHPHLNHTQPTATLHHCHRRSSLACHHHCHHLCAATAAMYALPLLPCMRRSRCTLCATGHCPLCAAATTVIYVPPLPHSRCPTYHPLLPHASHPCPRFSGPTTAYLCTLPRPAPSPPPHASHPPWPHLHDLAPHQHVSGWLPVPHPRRGRRANEGDGVQQGDGARERGWCAK